MLWRQAFVLGLTALGAAACGGESNRVGFDGLDLPEPANSFYERPSGGDLGDGTGGGLGSGGGTPGSGGTNGGGTGGTNGAGGSTGGGGLVSTCSGSYLCGTDVATLSSSAGTCEMNADGLLIELSPEGVLIYEGVPIGTWTGDASSFEICADTCLTCVRQ